MHIEINKALIPYKFYIDLGQIYSFVIRYNSEHDFFTADLLKDNNVIINGEKMVYGRPLFLHLQHLGIPQIQIMPYSKVGIIDRINYGNMNKNVFLYIGEDDE